jgi:NADH-quinone oxidoreductase subunit N
MNLHLLLPEIFVVLGGLLAVTVDLTFHAARRGRLVPWVAALGLAAALVAVVVGRPDGTALAGGHLSDAFSRFVRGLACAGGLVLVALSSSYTRRMDRGHGEFYGLLMFALLGVMLVSAVTDLMGLFVSLELITISSYVLAAFKRTDVRSTEAGLKYLVVGAVSSAFLLFGAALVFGATGSVTFATIAAHVAGKGFAPLLALGAGLVFMGLFFKCAAVPFQVWAPDVYQGAPSPVTAFLSSLSKSAGFVLLLRVTSFLVVPAVGTASGDAWVSFFGVVAALTLLYGNLGAMAQRDVKRLFAYSSIGHAGYMLMGVTVVVAASPSIRVDGAAAVLVYLVAYYVTTLTAFAVVVAVSAQGRGHDTSTAYAGLGRRSPFLAFAMLLALLSLAGVPPMAGLIGKFLVFYTVVAASEARHGLVALGVVGALGVVLSLYYYLLLIREMYAKPPAADGPSGPLAVPAGVRVAVVVGIVALLGLGIFWGQAYDLAHEAAAALFVAR